MSRAYSQFATRDDVDSVARGVVGASVRGPTCTVQITPVRTHVRTFSIATLSLPWEGLELVASRRQAAIRRQAIEEGIRNMDDEPEQPRADRGGTRKWIPATISALSLVELALPLLGNDTSPAAVMATGLVLWVLHTIGQGFAGQADR